MQNKKVISALHWAGYGIMLLFIGIGFYYKRLGPDAFMDYLKEDGLVENLTAIFLLVSSVIAVYRASRAYREGKRMWVVSWALLAFLFFFAAGEEISWGQRIFNIESSGFFVEKNLQKETNLHNLVIGGVKINKLIFSQGLTVAMVFYLLFFNVLARKNGFFNRLALLFGIPLPRWEHVVALAVGTLLVSQYHMVKAGELREFVFAVVFALILLNPVFADPLSISKPGQEA